MTDVDIGYLRGWIAREREMDDVITSRLAKSLDSIFDQNESTTVGQRAPAGIQWCLAPEIAPMSALGRDGHPAKGGFLPPVQFPRRMWAGGKLTFLDELLVGDTVSRRSCIQDVVLKTGRSGALIFVTVGHDYHTARGLALREVQDIVYREQDVKPLVGPSTEPAEPVAAEVTRSVETSEPLLFRYSAVTFNGHRIHYDRRYVREEEGYPSLVVHGPLQATYLLRLALEVAPAERLKEFSFRSVGPLYVGGAISLNANLEMGRSSLWLGDQYGRTTMNASALYI